jgi:hypothetical protein
MYKSADLVKKSLSKEDHSQKYVIEGDRPQQKFVLIIPRLEFDPGQLLS